MENLAALLDRITRQRTDLTPQVRKAADYVLGKPATVGTISMRKLAGQAGVPPTTLPRLAKAFGYETYDSFRTVFQTHLREQVQGYGAQAGQLQDMPAAGEPASLLNEFQKACIANVQQVFSALNPSELETVTDALRNARKVYVVGMQASHTAAAYFHYIGAMACGNWVLVDSRIGNVSETIVDIGPEDVLVAIAMPPSARETIVVAEFARDRGAKVVGITSSRMSPLAARSDHILLVAMQSPQFFESYVTTVLMLEILVGFIVATGSKEVIENITRVEACRRELGEYWEGE